MNGNCEQDEHWFKLFSVHTSRTTIIEYVKVIIYRYADQLFKMEGYMQWMYN